MGFLKENCGFSIKKIVFLLIFFEDFSLKKLKIENAEAVLHALKKFLEKTKKFFRKVEHHFSFITFFTFFREKTWNCNVRFLGILKILKGATV